MKIAVNTRLLLPDKLEGIGNFTFETLKIITTQHPEHQFYFIFDRPFHSQFIFNSNVTPIVTSPPARHPALFYLWFEHSVPRVLKKIQADIFLSPDGYLSLSTNVKSVPVIHDINFAHFPKDVPFLVRHYYNYFFPRFAKKANRIATVSEYSKMDIHTTYGIDMDKIDVVYNGVNEQFGPVNEVKKVQVKNTFSCGEDYFVFVGSLHPRKNIARLFKAFDLFKKNYSNEVKLVMVGERYWWNDEIENTFRALEHQTEVIFTGRLNNRDLNDIIASSLAMTYIPYFEGFGIPILEAFKCETAVITSNVTSMPEVAGDAAILIDPFDIDSIANAMNNIYVDKLARQNLIDKGRERVKQFSWQKTANKLWNTIELL